MFLTKIVETKRQQVEAAKAALPLAELLPRLQDLPAPLEFRKTLEHGPGGIGVIGELKKASPSKGVLRHDFDPLALALAYEKSGLVDAISVVTETAYFQGSLEYLPLIKEQVRLPLLRKDFIIDVYQLYESRLYGADAVLLIAGLLNLSELQYFLAVLKHLGLAALVEVHDKKELDTALKAGASIIGINNRNLKTFATNLETTFLLRPYIPPKITVVSESGIGTPEEVRSLRNCKVDAILVGEYLMRCSDLTGGLEQLLGCAGEHHDLYKNLRSN